MRRIPLLAIVVGAASLIPASSAFAINSTQLFKASVSPSKAGTKKKPVAVTLKTRPYFADIKPDAAKPFATRYSNVYYDKNLVFNGKKFPSCKGPVLLTSGGSACPAGSKVGKGTAAGEALGLVQHLTVDIYNGPGGNKVELLVRGSTPLVINSVIEGTLTKGTGKYGWHLKVPVPDDLQQPAPGVIASLTDFDTTIKATYKKVPYIALAGGMHKEEAAFRIQRPVHGWHEVADRHVRPGLQVKGKDRCGAGASRPHHSRLGARAEVARHRRPGAAGGGEHRRLEAIATGRQAVRLPAAAEAARVRRRRPPRAEAARERVDERRACSAAGPSSWPSAAGNAGAAHAAGQPADLELDAGGGGEGDQHGGAGMRAGRR